MGSNGKTPGAAAGDPDENSDSNGRPRKQKDDPVSLTEDQLPGSAKSVQLDVKDQTQDELTEGSDPDPTVKQIHRTAARARAAIAELLRREEPSEPSSDPEFVGWLASEVTNLFRARRELPTEDSIEEPAAAPPERSPFVFDDILRSPGGRTAGPTAGAESVTSPAGAVPPGPMSESMAQMPDSGAGEDLRTPHEEFQSRKETESPEPGASAGDSARRDEESTASSAGSEATSAVAMLAERVREGLADALRIPRSRLANGIDGGYPEVALTTRGALMALRGAPQAAIAGFLYGVMADSVAGLIRKKAATGEQLVDLVTAALDDHRPREPSEDAADDVLFLVAGCRRALERDRERIDQKSAAPYYGTRLALAQILTSGNPRPQMLRRGVFYFDEVLREYRDLVRHQAGAEFTSDDLTRIQLAANNGGNHLDTMGGAPSTEPEVKQKVSEIWSQIATINVLIGSRQKQWPETERNLAREVEGVFAGVDISEDDDRLLVALDQMMYGPQAWMGRLKTSFTLASTELGAALIRAVVASRRPQVASAFFNAGVSLLRMRDVEKESFASERMTINAMGMWWATLSNDDLNVAMVDGDGLDCAVNLFGAVADWHRLDPRGKESEVPEYVVELASGLSGIGMQLGGRVAVDLFRLQGSFSALGIESRVQPGGSTELTAGRIRELLQGFLQSAIHGLHESGDLTEHEADQLTTDSLADAARYTARVCRTIVQSTAARGRESSVLTNEESDVEQMFRQIIEVVRDVVGNDEGSLTQTVLTCMEPIYGEHGSMLVASGLMSQEELQAEAAASMTDPSLSLSDVLKVCRYLWLLEEQ